MLLRRYRDTTDMPRREVDARVYRARQSDMRRNPRERVAASNTRYRQRSVAREAANDEACVRLILRRTYDCERSLIVQAYFSAPIPSTRWRHYATICRRYRCRRMPCRYADGAIIAATTQDAPVFCVTMARRAGVARGQIYVDDDKMI